jgi:uncharacterized protein (DUF58 family)
MKLEIHKKGLIIYSMVLIASVVFSSFYGGPVSYGLLYGLLLLLPLSILYTCYNYWFLKVYQEIEVHKVVKGELHRYRVIFENAGWVPIYKMVLHLYTDRCELKEIDDKAQITLAVHEKKELTSGIKCTYAGAYNVGINRITLKDPFGIYSVELEVPYKFRAVVKPQITDMANQAIEIENIFNSADIKSDTAVEDIPGSDSRAYQRGDSLHAINWKVSARLGELVVRVPDKMEKQTVTMLLIADVDEKEKYSLEAIKRRDFFLEFIVSAAWLFGEQQVPVKFIYPSGKDLTGCSDGYMLVLAPYADYSAETAAKRITRAQCLSLNDYAADLANVTLNNEE